MSGAVEGVALLPCPFCGGEATAYEGRYTSSVKCDNSHAMHEYKPTLTEAIAAWNTRTTPPARSYADGVDFRALLIEAGRNAGAYIDDRASDEFLKCIPEEVRLKIAALLSQGGKA